MRLAGGEAVAKSQVIKLSEKLDISKVESLLEEFRQAAEKGGSVSLDASAVQRADTAGLQLLFSLQKTLAEQGGNASITGASEDFMACASLVGFDKVLTFQ